MHNGLVAEGGRPCESAVQITNKRQRLRPGPTRRRDAIRQAASRVFLREGFAASVDRVAAEAHVSRRTVFNLFRSKNELFAAILSERMVQEVDLTALEGELDLETALRRFADSYAQVALCEDMVHMARLVYAEYPRFPELVAELATRFISQMHPPLVAYLRRLIRKGTIVELDCELAAEQFLASVLGRERDRIALGVTPSSASKRRVYLDQVVRQFVHGMLPGASSRTSAGHKANTTG